MNCHSFQNYLSILIQIISIIQVKSIFVYYQNYEYLSTVKLNDYGGYYGNVKILRYSIPHDVISAIWRLQLVATDSCPVTNIYFYLDYAAYPVISPNNRTFPQNFNLGRLTKLFVKQEMGGGPDQNHKKDVYLNVSSPYSGYWFSAAFIDNTNDQIKPDLLRSNCSFYLTASINLWQINDTTVLYPNSSLRSGGHDVFRIYKYITVSNDQPLTFKITYNDDFNKTVKNFTLTALLRQSAFPDMTSFKANDDFIVCQFNSTLTCKLTIDYPLVNTWYYLATTSDCDYKIDVLPQGDCETSTFLNNNNNKPLSFINNTVAVASTSSALTNNSDLLKNSNCLKLEGSIETFRFIGPTYFSVKYYFNSNYNRSNALLIRNQQKPYFIEFLVDLANNGGTLNFQLVNNLVHDPSYFDLNNNNHANANTSSFDNLNISNSSNSSSSALLDKLVNTQLNLHPNNKIKDFNIADVKVMLHICLLYNSMNMYKKCPSGYEIVTQSITNVYSNIQMNIAYPYIGKWYLAVWKECLDAKTNEVVTCPNAYVPYAVIQISSDQCANDYCGEYGTCYIVNSQLNLVSTCKCSGGYEGYGCTDSRTAISSRISIASVIFLTTSNLVFLLPIGLALYRRWYIESLIYFYNMFFSTFYHACDQEFYSFCIFNYDGLQLADFISSYASFVITILAMSTVVRPWKVFTFFVGLLACLTINLYDRFNYVAFIVFLCISISVTVLTWVRVCLRKRVLHPHRKILLCYYLPGFTLAASGLLIYSFFQTKSNYWYLHSIWHMCMASSILFFLPKQESKDNRKIQVDDEINAGENLHDVTTTTSSLSGSGSSGSSSGNTSKQTSANQSPKNHTEIEAESLTEQNIIDNENENQAQNSNSISSAALVENNFLNNKVVFN